MVTKIFDTAGYLVNLLFIYNMYYMTCAVLIFFAVRILKGICEKNSVVSEF